MGKKRGPGARILGGFPSPVTPLLGPEVGGCLHRAPKGFGSKQTRDREGLQVIIKRQGEGNSQRKPAA